MIRLTQSLLFFSFLRCQQTSSDGNETRGMLQFLPTVSDGGKRLTCVAKNVKMGALTSAVDADGVDANSKAWRILVVHCKAP